MLSSSVKYFETFLENDVAKQRVGGGLDNGCLPHAMLVTAEKGCGRNMFARLVAAAYLNDKNGLVLRGVHPDCLVVEGEGISGNIPVKRIRELSFALNMAAVMTDGRRIAILKNVKDLNRNSANALLKILEEPPNGVMFVLTTTNPDDVLETVRSRCVRVALLPVSAGTCLQHMSKLYPDYDADRLRDICSLYDGRLGFIMRALESPERLSIADCAARFCDAAIKLDKLAMLTELECVSATKNRDDMRNLLTDAVMYLKRRLRDNCNDAAIIDKTQDTIIEALRDLDKYVNIKLLATKLVAVL